MPYLPGHFYSPIPDLHAVEDDASRIFAVPSALPGVSLRATEQRELVARLSSFYAAMPFEANPVDGMRYYLDNSFFNWGDGVMLYAMLRWLEPPKVLEIGAGFSSALILDVNEQFFGGTVEHVVVEPHTERLASLLKGNEGSRLRIVSGQLQDFTDLALKLKENDVLFIDSSHVAKVGSDVNSLFFDVLPNLAPGVVVHLHDVFYPFEYPRSWIFEGRSWNEAYMLRAFLTMNAGYEVLVFNSFLDAFYFDEVADLMPAWRTNPGGSIWLRRVGG